MKTICIAKADYPQVRGKEVGVPMDGFFVIVDARCSEFHPINGKGGIMLTRYGLPITMSRELAITNARLRAEESGLPYAVLESVALLQPSNRGVDVFTALSP